MQSVTLYNLTELRSLLAIRSTHFANFHACLRYGIILFGAGILQIKAKKSVMRIMSGVGKQSSCTQIFRNLNILPVACIYINETMCYITRNSDKLEQKIEVYNCITHEKKLISMCSSGTQIFLMKSIVYIEIKLCTNCKRVKNNNNFGQITGIQENLDTTCK